jgi:hypothetical protein
MNGRIRSCNWTLIAAAILFARQQATPMESKVFKLKAGKPKANRHPERDRVRQIGDQAKCMRQPLTKRCQDWFHETARSFALAKKSVCCRRALVNWPGPRIQRRGREVERVVVEMTCTLSASGQFLRSFRQFSISASL